MFPKSQHETFLQKEGYDTKDFISSTITPLLTAFFFGTGMVASRFCATNMDPFSKSAFKGFCAATVLFLICKYQRVDFSKNKSQLLLGGILSGCSLLCSEVLSHLALRTTAAGKASFLISLYVVIVPILGMLKGKKISRRHCISILIILIGLYFLCGLKTFTFHKEDGYLLIAAFMLAVQFWIFAHFLGLGIESLAFVCVQNLVTGLLASGITVVNGLPTLDAFVSCIGPLLYSAVFCQGFGHVLQGIAQKHSNPTHVAMIMSFESVFASLVGALVLKEYMSGRQLLGCVLMLFAIIYSQLPQRPRNTHHLPVI